MRSCKRPAGSTPAWAAACPDRQQLPPGGLRLHRPLPHPGLAAHFDVANPDTSISRRAETIHPLQSLYFLNSVFVRAQAEAVLKRTEIARTKDRKERIIAIAAASTHARPMRKKSRSPRDFWGMRQWTTRCPALGELRAGIVPGQ